MARTRDTVLKGLAIAVAIFFALGVVLATGELIFFGSSKISPLFGMSAEYLGGDAGVAHRTEQRKTIARDAGPLQGALRESPPG